MYNRVISKTTILGGIIMNTKNKDIIVTGFALFAMFFGQET